MQTRLILASRSPRRAQLMREAGYEFTQAEPAFADPPQPEGEDAFADPAGHAVELAVRKAESLRDILADHDPIAGDAATQTIIISADTICVGVDGSLIGQPADAADARRMIRSFADGVHDVVTGVALLRLGWLGLESAQAPAPGAARAGASRTQPQPPDPQQSSDLITFADIVPVTFGPLTDARIDSFIASNQWKGKAGGYNLFDRQAAGWPITTPAASDPTTVVGLPMRKLAAALARWGGRPLEPGIA
jgi:septum formation protein